MRYTFEIQWPLPFKQGWQKSGLDFKSYSSAAEALASFLVISAENDCLLSGRLVDLTTNPRTKEL